MIELTIDIQLPKKAIIIDHHNERAGKEAKTSIEQVAELLGIRLNRHQELISANDKGHIKGMRDIGATDEEIRLIRMLDRQAQGVTEEDERLAEESINRHLQVVDEHTAVVHSLTKKTSAVFDRLYDNFQDLYVITPDGEINFSGRGETVMRLVRICEDKKLEGVILQYWYGGDLPERGYFGVKGEVRFEIGSLKILKLNIKSYTLHHKRSLNMLNHYPIRASIFIH